MLVPARVAIALRCPLCGKSDVHLLSLFLFSGANSVRLECSCGHHQTTVSRRAGKVRLEIPCYLCDGLHQLEYASPRFWQGLSQNISCPETGLLLAAFGPPDEVEALSGIEDDEVDPGALEDYFVNPEVMYEVLAAVHELDEAGRLRCRCGNTDIEYELQPERLDLICPRCHSRRSLGAAHSEDANRARRQKRLELGGTRGGRGRTGR